MDVHSTCKRCGREFTDGEGFVTCPACRRAISDDYGGCRHWDIPDPFRSAHTLSWSELQPVKNKKSA